MTLLDLVATLAIIGILVGLLLPAVQAAREHASRVRCSHHLRQLGTALQVYHGEYACLPIPYEVEDFRDGSGRVKFYSAQSRLLPFLGYAEVYESINFSAGAVPEAPTWGGINGTAAATTVALFLCPSDRPFPASALGAINYRINVGPTAELVNSVRSGAAPFAPQMRSAFERITRGLSNTAVASEKLIGDNNPAITPARDAFLPAFPRRLLEDREYIDTCGSLSAPLPPHFSGHGSSWLLTGTWYTWYNHALGPNTIIPDCGKFKPRPSPGLYPARSLHPGGVNVLLADGAVRFIEETIDLTAWRSLGDARASF